MVGALAIMLVQSNLSEPPKVRQSTVDNRDSGKQMGEIAIAVRNRAGPRGRLCKPASWAVCILEIDRPQARRRGRRGADDGEVANQDPLEVAVRAALIDT